MKIKCFGIAKDIVRADNINISSIDLPKNVKELKKYIHSTFPEFHNLNKCMIAVNQEYAEDDTLINQTDEIAIIPPVSGG